VYNSRGEGEQTHLDVFKVGRLLESRVVPVKVLHPSVQIGVVVTDTARLRVVSSEKRGRRERGSRTFRGCT